MRANRRTDTKPELALRHALHRLGYRYRKDYRLDLDGGRRVRPDIAFTARKVAVFVDGCFWHACPEHGSKPRANEWYWGPKLVRNVERDRINDAALILAGWSVIRLWEHVPLDEAVRTVVATITAPNPATAPDSAATSDSAGATSNPAAASNPATAPNPVTAPDPAAAVSDPATAPDQANPADAASSDDPSKPIPPAADDSLG
jgi:DNA mismatch endonuclease, patch repair protein